MKQTLFFLSFFSTLLIALPLENSETHSSPTRSGKSRDVVQCTAKVTLHRYDVRLDTSNRLLTVTTSQGVKYEGTANYYASEKSNRVIYYLPVRPSLGLELEFEQGGQERIALCLKENECYLCR